MSGNAGCDCCDTTSAVAPTAADHVCYCPVDDVLDVIAKKHALQIIGVLGSNGPTRYGELEDALGITSDSLLSARLEELTAADLVERRSFDEVPPRVEYSLTSRGRELETRIQPLLEWARGPGESP